MQTSSSFLHWGQSTTIDTPGAPVCGHQKTYSLLKVYEGYGGATAGTRPFSVERLYSFYYMPKGFALNQLCGILEETSVLQQFREEMNHMGATYPGQVGFTQEGSCHSQRSLRNMGGGESFSIWGILGVRK